MTAMRMFVLSVLAGSFIAFGAIFATTVTAGSTLPFGITKLVGGVVFSLGLILVIVGGAELFTGNNLIVMAWASKKVSTRLLLRNWMIVYAGNLAGSMCMVAMILLSGYHLGGHGQTGVNMVSIAVQKCSHEPVQAFVLGILCNILVCLAVWLSFSAATTTGKILSVIFPISAFVAAGFEHCVANMYFIPAGMAVAGSGTLDAMLADAGLQLSQLTVQRALLYNLLPVTLGNIVGGAGLVGLVYWFVYLRGNKEVVQ